MTLERLSRADGLLVEHECTRVVMEAVAANDRGDFEEFASWFLPDGVLRRPGSEPLVGREAIVAAYRARPPGRLTRHIVTNVRIRIRTHDSAHGLSYVLLYGGDATAAPDGRFGVSADPRTLVGEFEDEFVLTEHGWRIAGRTARFVLHQD